MQTKDSIEARETTAFADKFIKVGSRPKLRLQASMKPNNHNFTPSFMPSGK